MGKVIDNIAVRYTEDGGLQKGVSFHQTEMDDFFRWLITEGFYDDIKVSKHFTTSKEVMDRLTS